MGDYYTEDPARLQGKPKQTIADYVESQGILVPRRFASLNDALAFGDEKVFVRSEHPDEYAGPSGLFDSVTLAQFSSPYDDLRQQLLDESSYIRCIKGLGESHIHPLLPAEEYAELMGIDPQVYLNDFSYSFWEKIKGIRWRVVADSAIEDRFHFTSKGTTCHYIIDGDELTNVLIEEKPLEWQPAIDMCKHIRSLPHFDEDHCPIIEGVIDGHGNHLFLQYHRCRDFEASTFRLDEGNVYFARGATPPEGIDVDIAFTSGIPKDPSDGKPLFLPHVSMFFAKDSQTEAHIRDRETYLMIDEFPNHRLHHSCAGHANFSRLFKPKVSLLAQNFLTGDEGVAIVEKGKEDSYLSIPFHIVSDGINAQITRI